MSRESVALCFGETLWDLLPSGPVLGGAPFNFAYRMHERGNRAYPVSSVGSDELGHRALRQMEALGLPTEFVEISDDSPTGTVPVTIGAGDHPEYLITPDVAYDRINLSEKLVDFAAGINCFYFGTLAQRSSTSHSTLLKLLDTMPSETLRVCDLNLRRDCYTRATVLGSLDAADIVKLSSEEIGTAAEIAGIVDTSEITAVARQLRETFALRACVVTRGADGVIAVGEGGETVDLPGVSLKTTVDTIGAGDAFLAGFADAILRGGNLESACLRGNILGALATQSSGGTGPITDQAIADCDNRLT